MKLEVLDLVRIKSSSDSDKYIYSDSMKIYIGCICRIMGTYPNTHNKMYNYLLDIDGAYYNWHPNILKKLVDTKVLNTYLMVLNKFR